MRPASAFFFILLAAAPATLAQNAMVEHETYLLQFIGGGQPLTEAERAEVKSLVAAQMQQHPAVWTAADQSEQNVIATMKSSTPEQLAALWDASRYVYAFAPAAGSEYVREFGGVWQEERRIIEAHDPVLGIDPARKLVVTAHMVPAMRAAATWAEGFYQVAGPGADFDTTVTAFAKQLPSLQVDVAFGLAHIVALNPLIKPAIAKAPAGFPEQVSKQSYRLNFAGKTGAAEQYQLVATTAGAAVRWGIHNGGQLASTNQQASIAGALYMHKLALKSMHDAVLSANPHCNPILNDRSTLASYGCQAPIPIPGAP